MPSVTTTSRDNAGHEQAALRDLLINHNKAIIDLEALRLALSIDAVWSWQSSPQMGIGSTDTAVATGAFTYGIGGVGAAKAAVAAGTALTAGTIPQDKWGVYAYDIASGGAISVSAGAANTSTGYASEAAALAATPARLTAKGRIGVVTVQTKVGAAFIAGTDSLTGGAAGNIANATNYYPQAGVLTPTGNVTSGGTAINGGGANGVLIPTVLSRGSTDTRVGFTAFTYNANGMTNLAKAAVAAGVAFGALGTVPAGKWALIALVIDSAGVVTFQSAPNNYSTGYGTEAAALADLTSPAMAIPAGKTRYGHVTILTKDANTAFIVGTDALAGGASGNVAATTNYYPAAGITLPAGLTAAQIGNSAGVAFTT